MSIVDLAFPHLTSASPLEEIVSAAGSRPGGGDGVGERAVSRFEAERAPRVRDVRCYRCNVTGHQEWECPDRPPPLEPMPTALLDRAAALGRECAQKGLMRCAGTIEGGWMPTWEANRLFEAEFGPSPGIRDSRETRRTFDLAFQLVLDERMDDE